VRTLIVKQRPEVAPARTAALDEKQQCCLAWKAAGARPCRLHGRYPRAVAAPRQAGAGSARLELTLWIETTLQRFPALALGGTCERVSSTFLNRYLEMPVALYG
jgi:hypothetical protein